MAKHKNDEIILAALLSCQTIAQAAQKSGVSTRVIYNRLAVPEFKARYDAERRALFDRSAAALQSHLNEAIEAMGEIVADKNANQQTRLNAAEAVIRNTLKLSERVDVLERLDALERRIQ